MCVENTNFGCTGSRMSRIPTSSTRRLPFRKLQRRQAATTFTQVVSPPRERGTTWSTVSRSPRRLQYWQGEAPPLPVFFFFEGPRAGKRLWVFIGRPDTAGGGGQHPGGPP